MMAVLFMVGGTASSSGDSGRGTRSQNAVALSFSQ